VAGTDQPLIIAIICGCIRPRAADIGRQTVERRHVLVARVVRRVKSSICSPLSRAAAMILSRYR
jgi:hypothetical protein